MDCCAFYLTSAYKIKLLLDNLRTQYKTIMYRDVLYVEMPVDSSFCDMFLFPYGAAVLWGVSKEKGLALLDEFKNFENLRLDEIETDEFTFSYGDTPKIIEDDIILPNQDILTKLAISHGIAQSVKLSTFETALQKTYNANKQIPEELSTQGKITLSRRAIRRKMGELFIERTSINLHMDVLDTPEFFWEYPELEPLYTMMANYLDVRPRVEVLNQRLDVVHGLFEVLGNELNHLHSSRLEWTIICLIIIEVVLSLLRDVFRII